MVLEYYGIFIISNMIAELGTRGRLDEPWEQHAITASRTIAQSIKLNEADKEYISKKRLEFRLLYEDQGWRKLDIKKR